MLVNNFSAGIWGLILACFGFFVVGPKLIMPFADVAGNLVKTLVNNGLLPLTSIFIEPAKILFLNNAINHGVLTPLGTNESLKDGKSILFLLEANPGLAALGPAMPMGQLVTLPDQPKRPTARRVQLWD